MQQQIRAFIGCKSPGETKCQCVWIKQMLGGFDLFGGRTGRRQLSRKPLASVIDQRVRRLDAKLPELFIRNAANVALQSFTCSQANVLCHRCASTDCRPPRNPSSAYGRHWSHVRLALLLRANGEKVAREFVG